MRNAMQRFWQHYRESAWLPTLISVLLLQMPSGVLTIFYSYYLESESTHLSTAFSFVIVPFFLILAAISLLSMFVAGMYQISHQSPIKGLVNVTLSGLLLLFFVIGVLVVLVSPPGVGSS